MHRTRISVCTSLIDKMIVINHRTKSTLCLCRTVCVVQCFSYLCDYSSRLNIKWYCKQTWQTHSNYIVKYNAVFTSVICGCRFFLYSVWCGAIIVKRRKNIYIYEYFSKEKYIFLWETWPRRYKTINYKIRIREIKIFQDIYHHVLLLIFN